MRIVFISAATVGAVAVLGATTSGAITNIAAQSPVNAAVVEAASAALQPSEAARLAKQASFGPTPELINAIVEKRSVAAWLDDQFSLSSSTYEDLASKATPANYCNNVADVAGCNRDRASAVPMQMRFYSNAISKNDQLRQRVAFALSQIVVASEQDVHDAAGLAAFNQILLSNAFGNYRDILKAVTLNGYMGDYLDMAGSNKSQPNENYARELMQLFSIGTVMPNIDGTPQRDSAGTPLPTYSNADVKEVARALTGWTYARLNGAALTDDNNRDLSKPMVMYAARYDAVSKTFLGTIVPSNAGQEASVDAVVDAVFNHPNTAPFICKRLIQQLTVANPSPGYVARVATVFADNGSGKRGDLKAVVRAIYLDAEARNTSPNAGKVKEPVLVVTSLARAIGFKTDGYAFINTDASMGQSPFRAASVFNFYPYDFPLPQSAGLVSPVNKLMTTAAIHTRSNVAYNWTIGGDGGRTEYQAQSSIPGSIGTVPDWASWEAYGADDGKIVDRINLVLLNGTMTAAQRQSLLTAMAAIKNSDPKAQTRKRAQVALYIAASSPLFQVDR